MKNRFIIAVLSTTLLLSGCACANSKEKKDEKDEKKNYIRKERTSQSFCRQFQVSGVQKDHIQASFANGVLTVTLPKETTKQVEAAKTIEIQ